ncbi:3,4-dihydroxy-2-butanone-4-phosphate synthase [Sphingomonas sp. G-3-2-10]|uniref:3,4-dihydroxy-2-butanone-4-phosphate synthase n=1 Tax=Sphingomonas sp. G-3-2-10 TaxID=2728838 RepID=UPI00146E7B2F|nr:3,4-dihydroxy-2-butanone-4-phosphate synthase [Sphingomonas sp. G-3-2-10]NML05847.1 3,4-dihydroxy-2-butanone-4-phosphate synthase [Sphingomonas sp. G-3-2-10]
MTALATTDEIIEEFRNHRPVVLVEHGAAEDVGVLVVPAQSVGPDSVTFMARHCRGIVMLALTADRVAALRLPPMTANNSAFYQQAFTVSIEALTGVTTGISAADRARTIQVAIDPANGPDQIVTPGHVFPVAASKGGVLARPGYTEAAIDYMNLAGLNPAAAMCGILDESGSMARMDQLVGFALEHDLRIGSIHDLIERRCREESLVDCVSCERFESAHGGEWELRVYRNRIDSWEHFALVKGRVDRGPVPAMIHTLSLFDDILGRTGPGGGQLSRAMEALAREEGAAILLIREPGALFPLPPEGAAVQPYPRPVLSRAGIAGQVFAHLGISSVTLLGETDGATAPILAGKGVTVTGTRTL